MHSFPSFGQACFHGKTEPVAGLIIIDMGTFLLENMLSAERAARRACVMTRANWDIVPNLILNRMNILCFPTWVWDWDKCSLKQVAPPLKTNHFCCHWDSITLHFEAKCLGKESINFSLSLSPPPPPSSVPAPSSPKHRPIMRARNLSVQVKVLLWEVIYLVFGAFKSLVASYRCDWSLKHSSCFLFSCL